MLAMDKALHASFGLLNAIDVAWCRGKDESYLTTLIFRQSVFSRMDKRPKAAI